MSDMRKPSYRCSNDYCRLYRSYVTNAECDMSFTPPRSGTGAKKLPSTSYTVSQGVCSTKLIRCTSDAYCRNTIKGTYLGTLFSKSGFECINGFCMHIGTIYDNVMCYDGTDYYKC